MTNVNLDALIQREDLAVQESSNDPGRNVLAIIAGDLEENSFFYVSIRKPDFQRETTEW